MKALVILTAVMMAATAWAAAGKSKAAPAGGRVKVVAHERLQALLPQLPGWKRGAVQGETVVEETKLSRVQVDYEKAESGLSFELMDTVKDKDLLAELRPLIKPGYSQKSDHTYAKATTVKGYPAIEEWTNEARNGYISVLVADRFVVKVTGSYVANVGAIRAAVEAVDFAKLAALE